MKTYKISDLGIINNFPDGDVNFLPFKDLDVEPESTLSYRILNPASLYLLLQIKNRFPNLQYLDLAYLPSRADRETDSCGFSLKTIAQIINLCEFDSVQILQPHSRVCIELIDNSYQVSKSVELLKTLILVEDIEDFSIIIPDKGASNWIPNTFANLTTTHGISQPRFLQLEKSRTTKNIVTSIARGQEDIIDNLSDNLVIVDDLIDGGGTFIGIANLLKDMFPSKKIYLIATHAIFSKGFTWFNGLIERIVCTDSYPHLGDGIRGITVIKA